MAQQQSSELLRVLEQLDDAAWAETLLPLLRANKSAGAVALACKQLLRLCQRNQRELRLIPGCYQRLHPSDLDAFSRPFPACSSVELTAGQDDHLQLAIAVPLLARLPKLQSLQLHIREILAPAYVVPTLQLLRLQLPQLRSLELELGSEPSNSPQAWRVLGAATQLTRLVVDFIAEQDWEDISLQHLSELRPLGSSLHHLELRAEDMNRNGALEDCSFLSSFSGLTSLRLPLLSGRPGLAAISSCTALQQLLLHYSDDVFDVPALDTVECAALAQLMRLTELAVPPTSNTPALLAALQCLSGLQVLRLAHLGSSHLPVLAALTKLTNLQGHWNDDGPTDHAAAAAAPGAHLEGATCPLVARLHMSGDFPPAAFPGAKVVELQGHWQPSKLVNISQHMKKLEAFICTTNLISFYHPCFCLHAFVPEAERVAAVRSLGQLAGLTQLDFGLNDDEEAAALGTVTQLQHLGLCVPNGSGVTAWGLSSSVLCKLSKLHTVTLLPLNLRLSQSEAMLLLAAMSGVQKLYVRIGGWDRQQQQVWESAAAAARQSGLQLPGQCTFS